MQECCQAGNNTGSQLDIQVHNLHIFLSVTPHQLSSGEGGIPAHPQGGLPWASSHLDHLEMKLLKAPELDV